MSDAAPANFRVIARDDYGEPVHCSFCVRSVSHVAVLSLSQRPELEERIRAVDGKELWVGLCPYCVLAMAKALASAAGVAV